MPRPSLSKPPTKGVYSHNSIHEAFVYHLQTKFKNNPELLKIASEDSFFILSDVYRLAASSWMVVNEYLNREFSTIEHMLEKQESSIRDFEAHLKSLYVYRRRCLMYHKLISEGREQCHKRGKRSWHKHSKSNAAIENANDLQEDFAFLQLKMQDTGLRTEKNINLLTALVAIGENKQSIVENHAVARITLLAMIFLPFSTVAAILGMPGNFAPGSDNFWVFWVVVLPLTALITGWFTLYDGFRRYMLNRMNGQSSDKGFGSSPGIKAPSGKRKSGTIEEHLPSTAGWPVKSWQDKSGATIKESHELEIVSSAV
jgi:Mg2+ and Co2+ transporter CorA